MAALLLKTEPDAYSWDDLVRDKKTVWDGVNNNLALKHIRAANKGDLAVIYHTGNEKRAVGVAQIVSAPYPDPALDDPRRAVFDIKPRKKLVEPVTLDMLKSSAAFRDSPLLRIGRLSVVPLTDAQLQALLRLGRTSM